MDERAMMLDLIARRADYAASYSTRLPRDRMEWQQAMDDARELLAREARDSVVIPAGPVSDFTVVVDPGNAPDNFRVVTVSRFDAEGKVHEVPVSDVIPDFLKAKP